MLNNGLSVIVGVFPTSVSQCFLFLTSPFHFKHYGSKECNNVIAITQWSQRQKRAVLQMKAFDLGVQTHWCISITCDMCHKVHNLEVIIIGQILKLENDLLFSHKLQWLQGYPSNYILSLTCILIYFLECERKEKS